MLSTVQNVVYKITLKNGKSYIGSTGKTAKMRFYNHCSKSKDGNNPFYKDWRKFNGTVVPKLEVIHECASRQEAYDLEDMEIKRHGGPPTGCYSGPDNNGTNVELPELHHSKLLVFTIASAIIHETNAPCTSHDIITRLAVLETAPKPYDIRRILRSLEAIGLLVEVETYVYRDERFFLWGLGAGDIKPCREVIRFYRKDGLTQNQRLILRLLADNLEDCGGVPPYSISSLHYAINDAGYSKWYDKQDGLPLGTTPTIESTSNIRSNLSHLLKRGLVLCESRIDDDCGTDCLPKRINFYQLANAEDRNKLLLKIKDACHIASKAHGTFFFSKDHFFTQPFTAGQKNKVINELKALMQKTHPDKVSGFAEQFKQLQTALNYVRDSSIDLLKHPQKRLR